MLGTPRSVLVVDEEVIGPDRYRVGSRLIPVQWLQLSLAQQGFVLE